MNTITCPVCNHKLFLEQEIEWGGWSLNKGTGKLSAESWSVFLATGEADVMELLLLAKGQTVAMSKLSSILWPKWTPAKDTNAIRSRVKRLRDELGARGEKIKTIYKLGYRLSSTGTEL